MDSQLICQHLEHLESDRKGSIEDTWDAIERFVVPFRGEFYKDVDSEAEVDWRKRQIYDSTAVNASQRLASALHTGVTNPQNQWFKLSFRDDEVNEDGMAKEWIEDTGNRVYKAIQESNFNLEINEHYLDLTGFGTAGLVEEVDSEESGKLIFQSIPIKELYFEEDSSGQAYTLYRALKMTAIQMVDKFGEEGVPDKIRLEADKPEGGTTRHNVVFCIYRRKNIDPDNMARMVAPSQRPWGYKYVLRSDNAQLGDEGGYYEMPAYITRWRKTSGSMWGYSPAHVSLADIMTLNQLVEVTLESLAKAVDPPIESAQRNIVGDLDLQRGGITTVRKFGQMKPIESAARVDWSVMQQDRLQSSIRDTFFLDQLTLKESPAMTATEVNERRQRLQQIMGPTMSRLETDTLSQLIKRTVNILYRAGDLMEMPDAVRTAELDIEYTGPMPSSMRLDEVASIRGWIDWIASLAEIFPEMRDIPSQHDSARKVGELSGVPAKSMNSTEEVKRIKKKREEQQAQQMEAAQEASAAGTIKDAGAGVKSLSEAGMQSVGGMGV